ncbi:hypothetical protein GBF38_001762 [Nibea albiflora]|uniref:Uncharacterized protein n=1 Tax=Nibea albiflora TaxID=240163 RepID=A0ACB7EVM1_NIBAL|nr:hypothetical protein GBF38_001762 [Nibea albiflora]
MKIHVSDESREAEAESEASGLEKEDVNGVKGNEESKIQMIRDKAVKRWANKMQKRDGGEDTRRSERRGKKARDFKDGTTMQPVALMEDCLNIQGTWEASNTVCESDTLCDPAVLVSATNSEPHIRNRRLSPGSGNCGGGGGGGCISGGDQQPRQLSPEGDLIAPSHAHAFSFRREKERKGQSHKGRSLRRESQKGVIRVSERAQKVNQKERWVEDSLSLLKPPPAFPVQDSPAKLQPAVSYASKVKAGAASGALEEDRPAIGVLLQNQWGLSFISEARPVTEGSSTHPTANALPQPTDAEHSDLQLETVLTVRPPEETPIPLPTFITAPTRPELDESNGKLLLSCRHLVEALNYHSREWNVICNKQKKVPKKVVWYKNNQEHPA